MLPPLCSHPVSFPPGAIYYHHFWRNPKFFTSAQFLSRLDWFSSTIFEEIRKKFTLPSLSPEHPVFVSPLLKKIVIFFDSIQFLSRMSRFFPTAFEKNLNLFISIQFLSRTSSFCLTIFEKSWKICHHPVSLPVKLIYSHRIWRKSDFSVPIQFLARRTQFFSLFFEKSDYFLQGGIIILAAPQ